MFLTGIRYAIAVSLLGAGALLAGCQSSTKAAAPAASASKAPTAQAASCPKCKVVWETRPASSSNSTPIRTQVMKCEDCTNAVTNLLQKGEFKHSCASCGDKVDQMCMRH